MSGYAPNPTSSDASDGAASLTAGLLARKGEALPAVDADAHAGVDIAMPMLKAAKRSERTETIENLYASNPMPRKPAGNVRPFQPRPANTNAHRSMARSLGARPRRTETEEGGRKATITFKMPARDFIRMRMGSKDLEATCQDLILDALDTYLDANDVAEVSDEMLARETQRLMQRVRKKLQSKAG